MASAIFELILFSLPSSIYLLVLRAKRRPARRARSAVGWRAGDPQSYAAAIGVAAVLLGGTYLALRAIPTSSINTSSNLHATYGVASSPSGYLSIALLAVAEEVLFRGFVAGLLFRRCGFAVGNVLQALIFLAPHLLLLLVSTALWPLLPVQLAGGWLLGWLRYRSDSIGPPSLAHAAANVLAPLLLTL